MARLTTPAPSVSSAANVGSFIVRVIGLIALLAVPILGTSYALVSSVSADISMAAREHVELTAFAHVIDLAAAVEAVHRDVTEGHTASASSDRRQVNRVLGVTENGYAQIASLPATRAVWRQWRVIWSRPVRRHSVAEVDRALDALQEIGNELDDDSPLDVDPNFAVQNLVALLLRQTPRSIVAIGHTADAVVAARRSTLDGSAIERIATSRALEIQPLARIFADIPLAVSMEPSVRAQLDPATRAAQDRTQAFERRVDRILASLTRRPADSLEIERLAHRTIDAHIALWRMCLAQADRLVLRRLDAQTSRRRIIVTFSLIAVILGALALTVAIRQMARRDRLELVSAKLESDKLRAELQQVSTERALRLQEAQFRSVFENADFGIVLFERSGEVARCNAAVITMLAARCDTILACQIPQIALFAFDRAPFTIEEPHLRADGSAQWLTLTFSGVYADGECRLVILLLRDTTEEKLLAQGLLHAATHDGLTQIANRTAFERELQRAFACAGEPFALLFIDLDRFKPINDTFGHAAGDRVLVTTAERLRSALASDDLAARCGGDEFAAIVRGCNDRATLAGIAARVGASVASPIRFGEEHLEVTASIGIAIRSQLHSCADDMKLEADRALYEVKANGGNGQRIAEPAFYRGGAGVAPAGDSSVVAGDTASSVFAPN